MNLSILFRRRSASVFLACLMFSLAACGGGGSGGGDTGGGDGDGGGGGGGGDEKVLVRTVFPPADAIFVGDDTITIRGTADAESGVSNVRVNGVEATSSDGFATWTATVSLAMGWNEFAISAEDEDGETAARDLNIKRTLPSFGSPTGIKIDAANNRALVLDSSQRIIFSVDRATGERSVITSPVKGSGPQMSGPLNLDINQDASIAYVVDWRLQTIFAVDLVTGNRSVVSSLTVGSGPALDGMMRDLALDEDNARIFTVLDTADEWHVVEIDIATGTRSIVASTAFPEPLYYPMAVEWDSFTNRIIVAGIEGDIVAVTPEGTVSSLIAPETEDLLLGLYDIVIDDHDQSAFAIAAFGDSLWEIDFVNGDASPVPSGPASEVSVTSGNALAFDDAGTLLVADLYDSVIAVDVDTGNRSVLAAADDVRIGGGNVLVSVNADVAISLEEGVAFVFDNAYQELARIDLANGARSLFEGSGAAGRTRLLIDEAGNRLLSLSPDPVILRSMPLHGGVWTELFSNSAYTSSANAAFIDRPRNRIVYDGDATTLRTLSLDDFTESVIEGSGEEIRRVWAMALDAEHDRILLGDDSPAELKAVSLTTGDRTDLIDETAEPQLLYVTGIGVADDGHAYLMDGGAGRIVRVALGSLQQQIAAGTGSGSTAPFGNGVGLALDEESMLAWTIETGTNALVVFDLVSGDHVIISR